MKKGITLSPIEQKILHNLSVEELRFLQSLGQNGGEFSALTRIVNMLIDLEKNHIFSLDESTLTAYQLGVSHAFSRGQTAFGVRVLYLIKAVGSELARREELQKDIRKKQEEEESRGK